MASSGDPLSLESMPQTDAPLHEVAKQLLGRIPSSDSDFTTLGSRLAKAINKNPPYTAYYIQYVMSGKQPMTKPLNIAAKNLLSELQATPPPINYKEVIVRVPFGIHVPEGTIVQTSAVTCICGESFIPAVWNQINHLRACACMRARKRRKR
jgi:hypothetical protein